MDCRSKQTWTMLSFFFFCFARSLAVGTKTGYKLYSLGSVEKLEEIYEYGKSRKGNEKQNFRINLY